MNKARGEQSLILPFGPAQTNPTITCAHCNRVRPRGDAIQNWCSNCDAMVCTDAKCACECAPFKRKLDEAEARYHALRSYGI